MAISFLGITLGRKTTPAPTAPAETQPEQRLRVGDMEEVGATGTVYYGGFLDAEEYNPDLRGQKAIDVYSKMAASDGQIKAILRALVLPIRAADLDVEAASEDPADENIAQVVKHAITEMQGMAEDDFRRQSFMGGLTYGHAVFEPVWVKPSGELNYVDVDGTEYLMPYKLAPRLQKSIYRWIIDRTGSLRGIEQRVFVGDLEADTKVEAGDTGGSFKYGTGGTWQYKTIPVERLLVYSFDRDGANYQGESVLRSAYKNYYYKDNSLRIQAVGIERHFTGVPYAILRQGITPAETVSITAAVRTLRGGEKAYIVVPEQTLADATKIGMAPLGFLEMPSLGNNARAVDMALQYHDRQAALSTLADFLSLGSGLGGNANVMHRDKTDNFYLAMRGYTTHWEDTTNQQLVRMIVDNNFPGVKKYPKVKLRGLEAKDFDRLARGLAALIGVGAITNTAELEQAILNEMSLPPLPTDDAGNPIRPTPPPPPVVPGSGVPPEPDPSKPPEPDPNAPPEKQNSDRRRVRVYNDSPTVAAAMSLQNRTAAAMQALAQRLADDDDDLTDEEFVDESHGLLHDAFATAFALTGAVTGSSWASYAANSQLNYLENFAKDIAAGTLSPAQIDARASQYAGQVWTGYQRGQVAQMGADARIIWHTDEGAGRGNPVCDLCDSRDGQEYTQDTLPGFPGDGDFGELCDGAANCRCWLEDVGPDTGEENLPQPDEFTEKEPPVKLLAEVRCWQCVKRGRPRGRLLGKNLNVGGQAYCDNCRELVEVREPLAS